MRYLVVWHECEDAVECAYLPPGKELQDLIGRLAERGLQFLNDVPNIYDFPRRSCLIVKGDVVLPQIKKRIVIESISALD